MFLIIYAKGMGQFYDKVFERVNGGISQCVTPFPYTPLERENEKPTGNILMGDVALCANLKKMFSMLKQGFFPSVC